ncbi:uncharacterized protein LOC131216768 [Anopheles bellator]|uniref:uncharacterized protein LOC131216768 n=1 Tax=Anopheles bellator TaxID=139047 RepID=UPI002648C6EE|nr:uncharacterized protein LOC131216768 [Anopheles bellator]
MDTHIQNRTASKMLLNISILSIALNVSYFAFLLYSNKLYDVGKCCSSMVLLVLPVSEMLKHFYIKHAFRLDGTAKNGHNSGTMPSGRVFSNKGKTVRIQWKQLFHSTLLLALTVLFFGFVCLVLGAPLPQYEETVSLSFTLTTVTIFPIMLLIGHSLTYKLLLSESLELKCVLANSYLNMLKNNCIGVILGAWGASVAAPLDWDRPWQVYPIPNIVGVFFGLFGMNLLSLLRIVYFSFTQRRIKKM